MSSRELRSCGWRGHLTYAPTEPDLAARLRAETSLGPAWRCLRCGDWVLGEPKTTGPAKQAPVPPRGKALRQLFILRLLAVERFLRGLVLIAAGYGVLRFKSAQSALRDTFGDLVPAAKPLATRFGIDLDQTAIVREATTALHAGQGLLTAVAVGLFAYGVLEAVEGVGLWLARRWAEYLTAVATAAFIPLEVYEMTEKATVTRIGAFVVNLIAIAYLIISKRLFGARGGRAAYEGELRSQSLLEINEAATDPEYTRHATAGRSVGMSDTPPSSPEHARN